MASKDYITSYLLAEFPREVQAQDQGRREISGHLFPWLFPARLHFGSCWAAPSDSMALLGPRNPSPMPSQPRGGRIDLLLALGCFNIPCWFSLTLLSSLQIIFSSICLITSFSCANIYIDFLFLETHFHIASMTPPSPAFVQSFCLLLCLLCRFHLFYQTVSFGIL